MGLSAAEIIDSLPSLRVTVEAHGLLAKKSLGQNFLLDRNITDKIIRLSLEKQNKDSFAGDNIYEIGPGPGGLTRSILRQEPKKLTVIEMDDRCISIMEDLQARFKNRLEIINGDALTIDIKSRDEAPRHIISNLPYNVSVPLLTGWLKDIEHFESLTLMFQKEVAERIMAPINTKDYGRLSILSQLNCKIEKLMDLNPNCFTPAPKIWSSVLLFRPLENRPNAQELKKLEYLTTLAFGQRRKMVRQSLKSINGISEKLASLGIEETRRAEQISPQEYLKLASIT